MRNKKTYFNLYVDPFFLILHNNQADKFYIKKFNY